MFFSGNTLISENTLLLIKEKISF